MKTLERQAALIVPRPDQVLARWDRVAEFYRNLPASYSGQHAQIVASGFYVR